MFVVGFCKSVLQMHVASTSTLSMLLFFFFSFFFFTPHLSYQSMMNANLPRSGGLQLFGACVGEKTMRIGDLLRKFPKIRRGRLFGKKTASLLYFCRKFDKNHFYNNHNYKNSSATFPSTAINDIFLAGRNISKSEIADFDNNHSAKKP